MIHIDNYTTLTMNSCWITTIKNEDDTRLSSCKDATPTSLPAVPAERRMLILTLSSKEIKFGHSILH